MAAISSSKAKAHVSKPLTSRTCLQNPQSLKSRCWSHLSHLKLASFLAVNVVFQRVFQHSRSANPHSPQWGVDWAAPGFCCAATSAASTACACGDDLGLPLPSNIFKYHQMSTHCKANTSNTQTKPKCSRGPLRKPSKYKATTTKKEDNKQVRRKKW